MISRHRLIGVIALSTLVTAGAFMLTNKPTRIRKGLRPLSQTGFIRIPSNPKQRMFKEGGTKDKGTVLSAYNEGRSDDSPKFDKQLHPTKGERKLSVKRARAQMTIGAIRAHTPGASNLATMREFIKNG